MKRFIGLLAVTALFGGSIVGEAAVLINEPFNQNGTMGTTPYADWTSVSGTGTQLNVSSVNGLEFGLSDRDYNRGYASQSGPVYFGIDVDPQTLPTSGSSYFVALTNNSTFVGRFFITAANSGANYNLGIAVGSSTPAASTTSNFSLANQRIVGRYDGTTGNIALWAGSYDPANPLISSTGSTGSVNGFLIRQADAYDNGGSSISLKNLVVSDDFASAVAVPEPSTLAIGCFGLLAGCTLASRRLRGTVATKN